jgi:uncharacterized protein YraI
MYDGIYSVPLYTCRTGPPQAYAEVFAAGAGGVTTIETCVAAAA